jgi:transposase InsO family protein
MRNLAVQHLLQGQPLPVAALFEALSLSRPTHYRQGLDAPLPDPDSELRDHIQRLALEWPSYGYRRITAELHRHGVAANHKRVLRLMREDNLLCLRKRSFIRTTDSRHGLSVYPNLVPELTLTGINQLWVADITYIRLMREFVYLAVILDAFSRRCVGWALEHYLEAELALSALRMALATRQIEPGLVHHSDQGVQYASLAYTDLLKEHGLRISMSRRGNAYDNAKAESFIKTLKYEEVYLFEYETITEARSRIGHFIEEVYNQKRLHSALGYVPPVEFEQQLRQSTSA